MDGLMNELDFDCLSIAFFSAAQEYLKASMGESGEEHTSHFLIAE